MVYGEGHVTTLLQDGLQKVLKGLTTFEEVYKLIEIEDDLDTKIAEREFKEKEEAQIQQPAPIEIPQQPVIRIDESI